MFKLFGKKRRKRQTELKQLAHELELTFEEKEVFSSVKLLGDFKLFQVGHSRTIRNILGQKSNDAEESIQLMDYHFVVQSGNTPVPFAQTVFVVNSKHLDLPHFRLSPKSKIRKWAERVSLIKRKETTIPNKKFNISYHLKSKEQERVAKVINEKLLYIMAQEENLSIEGINYFLIIYKSKKLLNPTKAKKLYQIGLEIYKDLKKSEN